MADQQSVTDALSEAIVGVAEPRLARLSQGLSRSAFREKVEDALEQLGGLSDGKMPNYSDPWVALFYVLWYQPAQINLVYSSALSFMDDESERWQFVDFGAGALAAQFGIALALAERGRGTSATVQSIEPNSAMFALGSTIWRGFARRIESARFRRLYEERLVTERLSVDAVSRIRGARRALLAVHAVYDGNHRSVAADMSTLHAKLSPNYGMISTHYMKADLARNISPFTGVTDTEVEPMFTGYLPKIRDFRREVWASLGQPPGITQAFLGRRVPWEWPTAAILLYDKNS